MNLQHNPASQGQDPPLPRQVDDHQRLIIEPEGFGYDLYIFTSYNNVSFLSYEFDILIF